MKVLKVEKMQIKEIQEMLLDSVTAEFIQELVDYRNEHLDACKKSEKQYLFYHYNFMLVLAFAIFSLFPISPFHWFVFAAGLIMLYNTYVKRANSKIEHNINMNLHQVSEDTIKRGKEKLYGIS